MPAPFTPPAREPVDEAPEQVVERPVFQKGRVEVQVRPGPQPGPGSPLEVALEELRLHLRELASRADVSFGVGDGVGATLLVEGRSVFAGSNPFTEAVDDVQYGLQRGPCLAAVATGRVMRSRTIGTTERRWGEFTSRAGSIGLRSVASLPVWDEGTVIGSFNLYGRDETTFDALDIALLQAGTATLGRAMLSAWLVGVAVANAQVLSVAVQDREDIDIATGLLMDRYSMSAAHARILIGQLAVQDQLSEAATARALTDQQQPPANNPRA